MLRRRKTMDEQACREALYGGPRAVRAEPLARRPDPERADERIRLGFEQRRRTRDEAA